MAGPTRDAAAHEALQLTDQTNLLPFRRVVPIFLGIALCILVSALDSTISATALPSISAAFRAGRSAAWVPAAYLLASTACQPLYGRFSDIFGRRAALLAGMGVYMLGCLAAGFARSVDELVAFRAVAGAGGGGIVSIGQIIISDIVSLRDRGKYQGIIGGFVAAGYAIGPLIGGVLAERVSWRWCFWVTLPVSLAAICVVAFVLPLKPVQGDMKRKLLAVDYLGTGLTLAGCTLVILPLIWGGVTFPWSSAAVLAPLCAGALVVALFCVWEWRGARLPIVPMYIFKQRTVAGVYITMFANGFIFFSSLYYLPQFFQVALGFSAMRSGIFLLPVLVSQTAASFGAGMVVSRTGKYRMIIHAGFAVLAVGSGLLSTMGARTPRALLVVYMLLEGTGAGGTLQTTTVAAQASVSRRDMSVVTAVRNFIRLLGGTLSLAVGSAFINNALRASMAPLALPPATASALLASPSLLSAPGGGGGAALPAPLPAGAAALVLAGYARGVRRVFVLNAALAAGAVAASVGMIGEVELVRGDEARLREEARRGGGAGKGPAGGRRAGEAAGEVGAGGREDVELGGVDRKL